MTGPAAALSLVMIVVHGPDNQAIEINPHAIVSMREPRPADENGLVHGDVHCIVNTFDGKFISTVESCDVIRSAVRIISRP